MESSARTISVVGHGSAPTTPDLATAHLGVECLSDTVVGAFETSAACLDSMAAALRSAGVDASDMATTGLSVHAERRWKDGDDAGLLGYQAHGGMRILLRSLPDAAGALQAAMAAGGSAARLDGFSLEASDPAEARRRAREAAWTDALARARQLAAAAGVRVGEVRSIQEEPPSGGLPPITFTQAAVVSGPSGIAPGEGAVTVSLAVSWAVA